MFSRKRRQPPIRHLVGEGSVLTGVIVFVDGIRIDGEVHGDVIATGDGASLVVISEKARLVGKVKGGHVIINGEVEGSVESTDLLELHATSKVIGDVRYATLEMHQGATISGDMRPLSAVERPALKLAASSGS